MLQVMTTDDSMSDDVFESPEDTAMMESGGGGYGGKQMNTMSVPGQHTQQLKTPSPTGYRDYRPPAEMLKLYEQPQDEAEQMVHKVRQNQSLVEQFLCDLCNNYTK
jgi:Ras-related protein Rab-37